MKQRITYILHVPETFDPSQIRVEKKLLGVDIGAASKEHRLTCSFSELQPELWQVLRQCHELHLRWVSHGFHDAAGPFVSRLSPGLHAFLTPQQNKSTDQICSLLKKVFSEELECKSVKASFIQQSLVSERFAQSSAYHYYSLLPSVENLVTYLQQKICAVSSLPDCKRHAASISSSSYFDIDFDVISNSLTLKVFWDHSESDDGWRETFVSHRSSDSTELGVLSSVKPTEPGEISLEGFLAVLGEDSKPSPTRFSFPSRHLPLDPTSSSTQSFTAAFLTPTGLHPTLALTFAHPPHPPLPHCVLHAYLTLPSTVFLDRYQFGDPLALASHRLRHLRSLAGETDLEAPDWVVSRWGSAALLELDAPAPSSPPAGGGGNWTVTVPTHLRYLPPAAGVGGLARVGVPWPAVFWACVAEEGAKMAAGPFDRADVGFDGLFGPRTAFYHVPPAPVEGPLVAQLKVPVLDLDRAGMVEMGTLFTVLGGFAWVVWKLLEAMRSGEGSRRGKELKRE